MKRFLLAATILAAAPPAHAALQVAFANSTGGSFFCADQTACDLDGAVNNILLINTMVGSIKVQGTAVIDTFGKSSTLTLSNLTIANMGSKTATLFLAAGDTGFDAPVTRISDSASGTFNNDPGKPFSIGFWADHADFQPAINAFDLPGANLFNVAGTVAGTPDSKAGTKTEFFLQKGGDFSMAEGGSLTLAAGSSITGFNESMVSGVPEPSTWLLGLTGFGFLAGVSALARRRSARFLEA